MLLNKTSFLIFHQIKHIFAKIVKCHCRKKLQNYGKFLDVITFKLLSKEMIVTHTQTKKFKYNNMSLLQITVI